MTQPNTLTAAQRRRAMNLNISLGTLGSIWLTVAGPQLVLNVFSKNVLGASSASLGLLVAVT